MANTDKKVKVKQIRSAIGRGKKQQATLKGLGLGKVGSEKVLVDTPAVRGMINQVSHMVEVQEV
jgi:large subunit ribosomal protein L30